MNAPSLFALAGVLFTQVAGAEPETCELRADKKGISVAARVGGQIRDLVSAITYRANDDNGLAFETIGLKSHQAPPGPQRLEFALAGPAADRASVIAEVTRRPRHALLRWTIKYEGEQRQWNGWTTGFRFDFAEPVQAARTWPVAQHIAPTGARPHEVDGDTPYRDTEWQMRQTDFADCRLIVAARWYDGDWIYGDNPERAAFHRAGLPTETPAEVTREFALFVLPRDAVVNSADLAAEASGRPLSLCVECDRPSHLYEPGENFACSLRVAGLAADETRGKLTWSLWDYDGNRLAHGEESVRLARGQEKTWPVRARPARRGVLFLAAELSWQGGPWLERATFGVLPRRRPSPPRADSPFGLAALIADPGRYPDQHDVENVLSLARRIGVRWLRGGFFPLQDDPSDEDERRVRERLEKLRRHGIMPHVQLGARVPEPADLPAFRERFQQCLERFKFVSPYIELGNELNHGGVKARDYIEGLLRPVHEIMRQTHPEGKVMSMGLGGVQKGWLDEFVQAGGMELIDVLSVHPGCHPRAPEFWEGWRGWVFRPQMLDAYRAAREHGGTDVWITEAYAPTPPGRSGLDVRTSADYLVRTYVCSMALGVKVIEWYQFQDGVWFAQRPRPDDIEYNFGLVYTDLTPKPAYIAYGVMTEQLEGARCRGRLDLGADDLYGVRFERDDGAVDVLWSYREKHETDIPWWPPEQYKDDSRRPGEPWEERWKQAAPAALAADGPVAVTDLMGNTRTLAAQEGRVELALTGSPVYVRGLGEIGLLDRLWEEIE